MRGCNIVMDGWPGARAGAYNPLHIPLATHQTIGSIDQQTAGLLVPRTNRSTRQWADGPTDGLCLLWSRYSATKAIGAKGLKFRINNPTQIKKRFLPHPHQSWLYGNTNALPLKYRLLEFFELEDYWSKTNKAKCTRLASF